MTRRALPLLLALALLLLCGCAAKGASQAPGKPTLPALAQQGDALAVLTPEAGRPRLDMDNPTLPEDATLAPTEAETEAAFCLTVTAQNGEVQRFPLSDGSYAVETGGTPLEFTLDSGDFPAQQTGRPSVSVMLSNGSVVSGASREARRSFVLRYGESAITVQLDVDAPSSHFLFALEAN